MSTRNRIETESHKDPDTLEREIEAKRRDINGIVDELELKLSPGEMFDRALGYARGNGGEFLGNLGATIRANPVPTLLTSIGLIWMMSSQRQPHYYDRAYRSRGLEVEYEYEYGEDIYASDDVYGSEGGGARSRVAGAADNIKSRAGSAADNLKSRAGSAADSIKSRAGAATDSVKGAASNLRDKASHAREGMSDAMHGASDRLRSAGHRVSDGSHRAAEQMRQRAYQARRGFDDLLHEQPLAVGAIGVAIGALLAAMLPATRREDEMLGATSDRAKERARELAEQGKQQARHMAEQGLDRAGEKLNQRGDSGPSAGSSASGSTGNMGTTGTGGSTTGTTGTTTGGNGRYGSAPGEPRIQ